MNDSTITTTGRIGYNSERKRFMLLVSDLWVEDKAFHCGDIFERYDYDSGKWISSRIEKHYTADQSEEAQRAAWYIADTKPEIGGENLDGMLIRVKGMYA